MMPVDEAEVEWESAATYGSAKAVTSLVLKLLGFEYPLKIGFQRTSTLLMMFEQDILPT